MKGTFLCRYQAWRDESEVVLRNVRNLRVCMEDEESMFVSGRQEVKSMGQERVKSWRKIVLGGVMMMNQKRKKQWEELRMAVESGSSSSVSSNSSSSSTRVSSTVNSSADMLVYAAESLPVSME